ncbi:MAG TPA: archease [Solirubrobacterales bacterium]|nr:archease [Solirubrobacterales bacterium]
MSYRLLDHTADLALEVQAPTRDALFAEAAAALTDCLTDRERIAERASRAVALAAPDLGTLMVDWLTDLLVAFEVQGFLAARARVEVGGREGEWTLSAEVWGEPRDEARHPLKTLVKGITYHQLEVAPLPEPAGGWRARITLDL